MHPGQSCPGTSNWAAEFLGTTEAGAGMGQENWEATQRRPYPTPVGVSG